RRARGLIGDYVADDDLSQTQSENSVQGEADSPDQLSVHTLTPVPADRQPDQPDYMPLFVAPQPIEHDDEGDDESGDFEASDAEQAERPAGRRRRRGRRGRGRGRGEQGPADGEDSDNDDNGLLGVDTDEGVDDSEDGDDEIGDEDEGAAEGVSRRRRRRRRRKAGSGDDAESNGSPDDPPNTVVHE